MISRLRQRFGPLAVHGTITSKTIWQQSVTPRHRELCLMIIERGAPINRMK